MKIVKLTLPFSLLGVTFVLIGLVLNDLDQIYFGIVWFIIAIFSFAWKIFHCSGD
jgi:hypothetical protein